MKPFPYFLAAFLIIGGVLGLTGASRASESNDVPARVALSIQKAAESQLGSQATRVRVTLLRSDYALKTLQTLLALNNTTAVVSTDKHLLGDILVPVSVVQNHQVLGSVTLSASIQAWGNVVVAARDIHRSQTIDSADVRVVEREITRLSEQRLARGDEAVGRQATLLIPSGAMITRNVIKAVPTIARGDHVLLVATSAGIRIESPGTAMEDGYTNGTIQVRSQYNKVLVGRVRGDQTVDVRLY